MFGNNKERYKKNLKTNLFLNDDAILTFIKNI